MEILIVPAVSVALNTEIEDREAPRGWKVSFNITEIPR